MLSIVHSGALRGIEVVDVTIEVNSGERGDPRFIMVGLPDAAVKESHDRVFSALSNSGFMCPRMRTTVNLAPGYIRKEGSFYDLPIALGVIQSTAQVSMKLLDEFVIAGELSLSGTISDIRGGIAFSLYARQNAKKLILPPKSAAEAALVEGVEVFVADSLANVTDFLSGGTPLARAVPVIKDLWAADRNYAIDFSDVTGQLVLRRAVEIAVAGGHNLLMIGSPGSGKSMVAKRIPTIMPRPSMDEIIDIINIYSAAGMSLGEGESCFRRPFRSPHHTISSVGLLGGGVIPGPGEVSLAHNGVLFLDELAEFNRATLEVLRQPLEDGEITISRSSGKVTFPCSIILVAAMNPCPCGFLGDKAGRCKCSPGQVAKYRSRISGPLIDRFDIQIDVPAVSLADLCGHRRGECSADIKVRVERARAIQNARFKDTETTNARMVNVRDGCPLNGTCQNLLDMAMKNLHLSARAYDKILKVARTIADLATSEDILEKHILEAIQYRSLDRIFF
ncbi:MAG: YifB family Mg chelatase-like AAA ATPase [Puniceicoccales bacterium]|jgi:magnesium chelatase family protein|nr:YifB family Mg chelatase-like AAA ATPase [Puniceicoccales bacterium]